LSLRQANRGFSLSPSKLLLPSFSFEIYFLF
jgi:hypothetical protein